MASCQDHKSSTVGCQCPPDTATLSSFHLKNIPSWLLKSQCEVRLDLGSYFSQDLALLFVLFLFFALFIFLLYIIFFAVISNPMGTRSRFVFIIMNCPWTLELLTAFKVIHVKAMVWNCVLNLKSGGETSLKEGHVVFGLWEIELLQTFIESLLCAKFYNLPPPVYTLWLYGWCAIATEFPPGAPRVRWEGKKVILITRAGILWGNL